VLSTPVRRLVIGAAAVSLSVPGALLFDSPISAEQSVSVVATPDTEPPAETTPAEPPAESAPAPQEDDNNWLLFIVLLAVLVAGVAVVLSLLGRNDRRPASASSPVSSDSHREQHNIMGTAQWFHDQLAVQLLGSPPDQALARWQYERSRVQSIAAAANQQAMSADDPWHLLANSILLLSGSIDTLLGLQVQQPRNDEAVQEAQSVANARQRQLQALLVTMWPMVQTP
jgi:hypothetical protein